MPFLINPVQLEKFRKSQKNVVVLDVSWHLPTESRHAHQEFRERHIPGARFLDLEQFHDASSDIPNMLTRDEALISKQIGELGITGEQKIIFYDDSKLHSSCRALWMFKVFGYNPFQLYVLDGGYAAWQQYGGKIERDEPKSVAAKNFSVNYQAQCIRTLMQMKANLHHPQEQVIDMRHPVRYAGGPESRDGMRAGHVPGSVCFPYFTMFEADGRFKPLDKIRKQLTGLGVDLNYPIVSMCGSGMTACVLDFVLDLLDQSVHAVYDGSWSEWGAETLYTGETSLQERPVITSLD